MSGCAPVPPPSAALAPPNLSSSLLEHKHNIKAVRAIVRMNTRKLRVMMHLAKCARSPSSSL